ncbi:hypothetical protein EVAR_8231_1 [Eumeta japonica]|uniref:HTH CENPB-type domain-containing protein n=1 Tax=Eumeta variegata TaxID=151549 RepID=A0A4C1TGQ0_EUMVA|nr:hypothetical protein EVAR_8231_1 [Eumeta japonica]
MNYGLTTLQVRKLAYEHAKALKCTYPPKWHETGLAGIDWIHGFWKRNSSLSLRKPENTRAVRCFAFNRIFNFDESGISTVLDTPKDTAKTQKQVGQIVSAERGELVTFGGIISASGNTVPPLFVFHEYIIKTTSWKELLKVVLGL